MDDTKRKELAREVAAALVADPEFASVGGQKRLAALLDYHAATANQALNHPDSRMTPEFIRRLAVALPRYSWAADRLKALDYPDTGAAPSPPDSTARREAIDRIVSALEVATRELKQLGRELE